MEVVQLLLAGAIGLIAINYFVVGVRILMGSNDAYEMNRHISSGVIGTMRGHTKRDEIDGYFRVNHGIAFSRSRKTGKKSILPQSSLSSESLLETLKR